MQDNLFLKSQILANGVKLTTAAIDNFKEPFLVKRRAYGNADEETFKGINVPQEIILLPERYIVGVILRTDSPWSIDFSSNKFFLKHNYYGCYEITFTNTPNFYGKKINTHTAVESIVTKISGHTLGLFINTNCFFAKKNAQCKYCSIISNHLRPPKNENLISPQMAVEATKIALKYDSNQIDSILISGGNFPGFDHNFTYYVDLAKKVFNQAVKINPNIKVVLNVFPPSNLDLIELLKNSKINLLISTEVFSENNFKEFCPGKSREIPKSHILNSLKKAVSVLGKHQVYSIVVHGLENDKELIKGISNYAELGIGTIVNTLHIDPGTAIYNTEIVVPSSESILYVASEIYKIYKKYGIDTHQIYGGRNSMDGEISKMINKGTTFTL